MNWTKRKHTTRKVEWSKKLSEEGKFTFKRKNSSVILDHDIPSEFNLDQILLFYVSPIKYTFSSNGSKNFPIKVLGDKMRSTATFKAIFKENIYDND